MESDFKKILKFFQTKQEWIPGDPDYDKAFCHTLVQAASAMESSIWRLDDEGRLHMAYGTNVPAEELSEIVLEEGEGISGAAAVSHQTIAVADATVHPKHSDHVDRLLGLLTHAMISAPIVYEDFVYGVVNILNTTSGKPFPREWNERLSAAATMYGAALAASGRLVWYDTSKDEKQAGAKKRRESAKQRTVVVGISPAVQEALHLCLKTGKMDMPVLVRGETGSGKELAARRIHEASDRAEGPFVEMNCAALTETLLESELFGHVKGSFSGATRDRQGKFLTASGGTLFLDEIGDMSQACQAKILRALQDKKVTPVGSDKAKDCDARVIAATNYDLLELVKKGRFREDLYYRLCGIEILMPPLRERKEDIYPLVMYFLNKTVSKQKQLDPSYEPPKLSDSSLNMLISYNWPGNVRQLEQAINAAVAICEGHEIQPGDFPVWLQNAVKTPPDTRIEAVSDSGPPYGEQPSFVDSNEISAQERARYMKALEATKYPGTGRWNLSAAARDLNIPRKTFTYRLKRLQIIR